MFALALALFRMEGLLLEPESEAQLRIARGLPPSSSTRSRWISGVIGSVIIAVTAFGVWIVIREPPMSTEAAKCSHSQRGRRTLDSRPSNIGADQFHAAVMDYFQVAGSSRRRRDTFSPRRWRAECDGEVDRCDAF